MALPLKKRPYRGSGYPSAKRMRYIEKQVYRNRPEMQTTTISVSGGVAAASRLLLKPCSNIISGTGVSERKGDKIRVYRIEVRGCLDQNLDAYIIQKKGAADPAVATFGGAKGAYLLDSENGNRYVEWIHKRSSQVGTQAPFKMSKSFKGGILVSYNSAGLNATVNNEPVAVILNTTGTAYDADLSVRLWYTDA